MPQDHAAEAWRDEFAAALEASPLSQADLARDIENALDCPDRLAQTQGYVRAVPVDTEATIRRDAALSAEDQRVLVRMYRALTGR
jgi:hypothetical protein